MILIVLTVAVIALLITVLALFLLVIGGLLKRAANNLDDGLQSMRKIIGQAGAIRPGVSRINKAGGELVGAVPLLLDDVEQLVAKTAPAATTTRESSAATTASPATATPGAAPRGVGYMDE